MAGIRTQLSNISTQKKFFQTHRATQMRDKINELSSGVVFLNFVSPEVPQAVNFSSVVQEELFSFFLRSISLHKTPKINKRQTKANFFTVISSTCITSCFV